MKRKLLTVLFGTLILFVWNAISWVMLPFHGNTLNTLPDSAFEVNQLQSSLSKDGVYHYPGLPEGNNPKNFEEIENKLKEGPRITLMVVKKGPSALFEIKTFAINLIFNLLTVMMALLLVSIMETKSLKKIIGTSLLIAIIVSLVSDLPQMNWYFFPIDYTLVNIFDHLIAFLLLGLLFARFTFYTRTSHE